MSRYLVESRHLPALATLKLFELAGPEAVALIVPRGCFKRHSEILREIGLKLPHVCLMTRSQAARDSRRSLREWKAAGYPSRRWIPATPPNPAMQEAFTEARAKGPGNAPDSARGQLQLHDAPQLAPAGAMPPHPQTAGRDHAAP